MRKNEKQKEKWKKTKKRSREDKKRDTDFFYANVKPKAQF